MQRRCVFVTVLLCIWLTGCEPCRATSVNALGSTSSPASQPVTGTQQMYVGRTTLADRSTLIGSAGRNPSQTIEQRLDVLGNIATSQRVLSNTAATLSDLGMKSTPVEILSATAVIPVRNTGILAIEVTLPNAPEAKVAADVLAAEFKKVYEDMRNAPISNRREFLEAQVTGAAGEVRKAFKALASYKRAHPRRQDDPELAILEVDAQTARDHYASVKKQLGDARMAEQYTKTDRELVTLDPAFVRRISKPKE